MLERINAPNDDIVAFEAVGKITQTDYLTTLKPVFEDASMLDKKIRLLFHFGERFEGFTAGGAWQDLKAGLSYSSLIDQCAIVSDTEWLRSFSTMFGDLIPFTVKGFKNEELHSAIAWLDSGPIGLDYNLDSERGLLKIEINSVLTSATFEKLSQIVDPFIEKKGKLNGLVLHLKEFPGWENLGSFIKHVQFVKNHHQKIKRVALSADGQLARIVPSLAALFVDAEVKQFEFDELEEAKFWAAAG